MRLRFQCGHTLELPDTITERPVCSCGQPGSTVKVSIVVRPPTFRGACHGPLATTDLKIAPWTAPLTAGKE